MWPDWLVHTIHGVKRVFDWFRYRQWLGIPLDLIVRFVLLGIIYFIVRRRSGVRVALLVSLSILLGKEIFDTFTVRSWERIHWPGFLDIEDVMSGLLGMATAEMAHRITQGVRSETLDEDNGTAEAVED